MRNTLVFAFAVGLSVPVLSISACGEGTGTTGSTGGGGYQGPCAQYTDCASCTDAVDECEWCAGSCVGAPPYDSEEVAGASCEWGWAASSYVCTDLDGIRIQPTTLEMDCRAVANNEEPRCQRSEQVTPGSIGSGPAFPADSGSLYGGFVDAANHRLVVGALTSSGASHGSIWSVDLASGSRTLISGTIVDPIQGEISRGSGAALGPNVVDVEPLSGTQWIAWSMESSSPKVFRVDADTGNRTAIEIPESAPCPHPADPELNYRLASFGSSTDPFSIAIGANGTVYLPAGDADGQSTGDVGIAAVSPSGACSLVTLGSVEASRRIGGGPAADSGYRGVVLDGGTLYAVARSGQLHAVDIASGNRTLISEEGILGEGPGLDTDLITLVDGTIWTSGDSSSYDTGVRVDVDPANGARTARFAFDGPVQGSEGQAYFMAPHPTLAGVSVIALQTSIVLFEASSGNSMILSR